ncbi:sporulation protein YqfD [Pelotomaculum propionicicum]|uniref:Stage IV sporulation protein YqfD n=1 Tax=Pelotomaculum propionicicum TaxID=258475 RepID=A0A4Y7RTF4_9FIRM|nr:sporulation protein YqfD [Pelotomaculum propionicicum]NLI12999.1 sporulation protein YqfD [Peptococcaceae bacterium]TEB11537.1 hypothetical protein Pmgp_01551 [Pelotomaculum propionicicum]
MFLFKLMSYLQGYLLILVTGSAPEKFVNMSAGRGIYLWDITRVSDSAVVMKVHLRAVKPLRHIARRTSCRFRIKRRVGFPFYLAWLKQRKSLALGAVFFVGALYFLSSFVWFIEVRGNDRLGVNEVLQAAAEAGLSRGTPKWRVDPGRVEANIGEKLPLVSWTGVYIKGAKATIEVAERTVPGEEDRRPANIIAKKSGLIKEILVLNGHPVVKEGDTVSQGQVLVAGAIPPPEEPLPPGGVKKPGEKPKPVQPARLVHASAIARARVWYEGYGESAVIETGRRLSGRSETRVSMKFYGKEIILAGSQNIPYELYEANTLVKRVPEWRNLNIPVELITVKYYELVDYKEDHGRAGARGIAWERALADAGSKMPPGARIQEQWMEDVSTGPEENVVRVKAVIETVEDIGEEEIINP